MTQADADAMAEDLRNAFETGLTAGDGTVFYEQQFERGLISRDELEQRKSAIAEMEQAWNRTAGTEARLVADREVEVRADVIQFELERVEGNPEEGGVSIEVVETLTR
jgi:hypothetical protein